MGDETLFQVIAYPNQRLAAIAIMKVANPASDHGVDFIHNPFKGHDRSFSFRKFGDPVFDLLHGFLRWLDMRIISPRLSTSSHPDRESEKVGKGGQKRGSGVRYCIIYDAAC
jgi:hypothetical protein